MKNAAYVAIVAMPCLSMLVACSKEDDISEPLLIDTSAVVQGRWSIEKVDHILCRINNCSSSYYVGQPQDYFEFRADSAFLVRTIRGNKGVRTGYKVSYSSKGSFILSSTTWSGKFEVKEVKEKSIVLENSFVGVDPKAVFTDIYYLYR